VVGKNPRAGVLAVTDALKHGMKGRVATKGVAYTRAGVQVINTFFGCKLIGSKRRLRFVIFKIESSFVTP